MEGRGKKILFGCLGGCGAVLLIFVGSCVGFGIWLKSPGEVLDPEVLMGPESTGYVEWVLRLEDPGTAEFTAAMLRSVDNLNRKSNSPLPNGLENLFNARQAKSMRKDMKKLFPVVVAWTAWPGDVEDEDAHLFSVSARGMGHRMIFLDWILGFVLGWVGGDVETVRHRGEKIYVLERTGDVTPAAFIRKGIVFVSTDADSARTTLDRLDAPADHAGAGADLGLLFSALPEEQALRGALTNRRGEVARVLDHLGLHTDQVTDEVWSEVRGLTVVANFRDEDVFAGTVEVLGPDTAWAQAHTETVGAALVKIFDEWEVEFETEVAGVDGRVRVGFSAADLLDRIEEIH